MTVRPILVFCTMSVLAGCMSGDESAEEAMGLTDQLSYAELNSWNFELIEEITLAGPTDLADLPDTGSIAYEGAMALTLLDGSGDGVIGQLELTADFLNNTISGSAGNFYDLEANPTDGALAFENTQFETSVAGIISGEVNGTVTFQSGEASVVTMVAGNFSGDAAEYVSGVMTGAATPVGSSAVSVQGAFYASQ